MYGILQNFYQSYRILLKSCKIPCISCKNWGGVNDHAWLLKMLHRRYTMSHHLQLFQFLTNPTIQSTALLQFTWVHCLTSVHFKSFAFASVTVSTQRLIHVQLATCHAHICVKQRNQDGHFVPRGDGWSKRSIILCCILSFRLDI